MVDLEFAFEPPSDEEIDYDDVSSGGEDEEEEEDSDLIHQRGHANMTPEKDEVDEDGSSDSEPDRQVNNLFCMYNCI
ncbi:hypothetical protein Hanom_Chr09g00861161 [Helianthus anomalus]